MTSEPPDGLPVFRRAAADDAVRFATAAFVAGERVDIGTLASQLSVSRATLHRWFGTRDQLLERMFVQLTTEFSATARASLTLSGVPRAIEYVRTMLRMTIAFAPVRTFALREPQLALRLLVSERGAVQETLVQTMLAIAAESDAPDEIALREPAFRAGVHVGMALQYTTLASGEEPDADRIADVVGTIITNGHDRRAHPR